MDLRTIVTMSTLLVMSAVLKETTNGTDVPLTSPNVKTNSTSVACNCTGADPAASTAPSTSPAICAPALGIITVSWTGACEGDVLLVLHTTPLPVCLNSKTNVKRLFQNVCGNRTGCENTLSWPSGKENEKTYSINETGAVENISCRALKVACKEAVVPDNQGQLQAYRVATALLCCGLLLLLLMRFTRPTVKALQKRLSDRRQNRWIGPTQSHSVSYHRGKTVVKSNDGEMRLSYPALERLAVIDSREPSSNRNSDYNL